MSRLLTCLLAGGVLILGACDDDETDGTGGTGATAGAAGTGGGTAGDAGAGNMGGVGGASGTAGMAGAGGTQTAQLQFSVELEQGTTGRGVAFSWVHASLKDFEQSELPHVTYVENCEISDFRAFEGFLPSTPNAGTLTIAGASDDDIVMDPLHNPWDGPTRDLYRYKALDTPRWADRESLTIEAEGGEILGFKADYAFPPMAEFSSSPMRGNPNPNKLLAIYRNEDLRVQWVPMDYPVGVTITQYRPDAPEALEYRVRCAFWGPDGTGRITRYALAGLDANDTYGTVDESRTELYIAGLRMERLITERDEVWVTLSHGNGIMVNVR